MSTGMAHGLSPPILEVKNLFSSRIAFSITRVVNSLRTAESIPGGVDGLWFGTMFLITPDPAITVLKQEGV